MALEPLVRLDSALMLWGGAPAPVRLQGRGCLFVMRFPGLLFDAPGFGKVRLAFVLALMRPLLVARRRGMMWTLSACAKGDLPWEAVAMSSTAY